MGTAWIDLDEHGVLSRIKNRTQDQENQLWGEVPLEYLPVAFHGLVPGLAQYEDGRNVTVSVRLFASRAFDIIRSPFPLSFTPTFLSLSLSLHSSNSSYRSFSFLFSFLLHSCHWGWFLCFFLIFLSMPLWLSAGRYNHPLCLEICTYCSLSILTYPIYYPIYYPILPARNSLLVWSTLELVSRLLPRWCLVSR